MPGQEFQGGLQHHFQALGGKLRQHDGAGQAQGHPDDHGPQGDQDGGDDHGQDAEVALGGGPVAGQDEVLQPGGEDEGKALHEDEDGDEGQGADGRQGQEQQDALDEFLPVHYFTPTRPSVSRILLALGAQDEVHEVLAGAGGRGPGHQEKAARQFIGMVFDVVPGGEDPVDGQGLDPVIHQAGGDVAHGVGVAGDNLPHRAVGVLDQGGGGDFLLAHDQVFEGLPGAGALFPGDQVDGMGRQLQDAPVGHGPAEDLPDLRQGDGGQGIAGVDDHRDAVKGDGDLHQFFFRSQQLPGRGPQVGGPLGGGIDAGAGAAALHIDADPGVPVHVDLRQFFREGLHRGGAGDAQGAAGGSGGGVAAAGPQEGAQETPGGPRSRPIPASPAPGRGAPRRLPGFGRA